MPYSQYKNDNKSSQGFTLIELLVTIAVLGILAGGILIALNITGITGKASLTKTKQFAAQLERGLTISQVGKWSFEEQTGTIAKDTSGYGNNGILSDSTNMWQNIDQCELGLGGCLKFDPAGGGTNDYVNVGDPLNGSLDFGIGDFTLSAWFKLNSLPSAWTAIVHKGSAGAVGYAMDINTTNKLVASIQATGGTNQHSPETTNVLVVGRWYHGVIVFDRDVDIKIYLDGSLNNSGGYAFGNTNSIDTTNALFIGAAHTTGWFFPGFIDEVQIYKEALTLSQIQHFYAQGVIRRAMAFR